MLRRNHLIQALALWAFVGVFLSDCSRGTKEGIQIGDRTPTAVAAEVLPGTWVWTWSGKIRGEKRKIVTTLEIESVQSDGHVAGTRTIVTNDGAPDETSFGEKDRVYSENGTLRLRIESSGLVYDLMPLQDGGSLYGSFTRPGWTADDVEFKKSQ